MHDLSHHNSVHPMRVFTLFTVIVQDVSIHGPKDFRKQKESMETFMSSRVSVHGNCGGLYAHSATGLHNY